MESLEKLNIVELNYFFIYTVNFFFVNTSCWNQLNTIWYINLNCKVDYITSCYIAVHCLNFELCVYLLIMCAFVHNFSPKDTINVLLHFHFSNNQLPISEQEQLQKQLFRNEMTIIETVKNQSPLYQKYPPSSMVEVGDLVYNFCDGGKFRARNCYLVVSTGGKCCQI